jgi:hypothetical protein
MGAETPPEVLDQLSQLGLVVLDGQNVIGTTIPDRLRDVGLGVRYPRSLPLHSVR